MRTTGAMSNNGNFVVTDLYLMEGGRYNERFLRSLKMGPINENVIDRLTDEIMRTNGSGFSSGTIADTRTPIITLEDSVDRDRDRVDLVNGWDAKHFCFICKIVEEAASIHHAPRAYLVSGYTDKMEYTKYSKSLPDDLEFFVNSIIETSNERASNNNMLFSSVNKRSTDRDLFMMRPQDVLSRHSYAKTSLDRGMDSSYRGDWIRDRVIAPSSRTNNIGANYLAKTLTGLHKNRLELIGEKMMDDRYQDDDNPIARHLGGSSRRQLSRATELEDELEHVRNYVGEDAAEEFEFIRSIKEAARDTANVGAFRFRQLKRICPDIESIVNVSVIAKTNFTRSGMVNNDNRRLGDMDGERFGYATQEELIATNVFNAFATVANASFVMMIDIMFALKYDPDRARYDWDFEVGYDDRGRTEEGTILFLDIVSENTQRDMVERLGQTMIDSVLTSYSRFGYEIMIGIRFNMNREMFVTVAIDTDSPIEFCSAIFCDALTPPVISNTERTGARLGEATNALYNEIHRAMIK